MLGKIKCWHRVHKRVAVPAAYQLDVAINPVQKPDLCHQILTFRKRAVQGSGHQRYPPFKQGFSSRSLANRAFLICRTLLGQYRKDLGVLTSTAMDSTTSLHFPWHTAEEVKASCKSTHFFKRGSSATTEQSCADSKSSLNPPSYSISEHSPNYSAISTCVVWPQALGFCWKQAASGG